MSQYKISKARLSQIIKEEYEKILLEDEQRTDEGYMDALDRERDDDARERRRQLQRIKDEEERKRRSGGYRRPGAGSGMGGIGGGGSGKKRFPGFNRKDEKMDAVGKEDADADSSDEYLKKRRKAIGKAMKKESLDSIRDLIQQELKNF